ncbi:MAG: hypothetical protein ACOX18_00445 [Bacillota bacterium]
MRKGIPSFLGGFELYNEICAQLQADVELVEMLRAALTPDCYPDPELKTLTIDVSYYNCQGLLRTIGGMVPCSL